MRAIIIDRWAVLRDGMRPLLGGAGHQVVRAVDTTAAGAALLAVRRDVDLVVLGEPADRPVTDAAAELRRAAPGARVLVLVDDPVQPTVDALLDARVAGIVGRLRDDVDLLGAVERIADGEHVLSSDAMDSLVSSFRTALPELDGPADHGTVSPRQRELLAWLHRGATTKEIATRLFVGQAAVERQVAALCRQLGVAGRDEAVAKALRLGLVEGSVHWAGGDVDPSAPRIPVPTWERRAS